MIVTSAKVLLAICVLTSTLSSVIAVSSSRRCKVLTRKDVELELGKPIKCLKDSEGVECFQKKGAIVSVQFDSFGDVKRVLISTGCIGMGALLDIANQIVPKNSRGKPRQLGLPTSGCETTTYVEEYECLTMEYTEVKCQDCAPAFIKIVWKP